MALEQQVIEQQAGPSPEQEAPEQERLTDEEEDDLAIAVMLAENLIDDGGQGIIKEAVATSNDPGTVIGQFMMQLVAEMSEQMPPEASLSPRVFLAEGGWVEQISDYIQEQFGVSKQIMDKAEIFIATQSQSMANGAVQQQEQMAGQEAAMQQPAPMPQPGGMV